MKKEAECAEVIVRLDYLTKQAHICVSAWPSMARKMVKLYGLSKDGRNTPRAARWQIPLKMVSFRRPAKLSNTPKIGSVPRAKPTFGRVTEKSSG